MQDARVRLTNTTLQLCLLAGAAVVFVACNNPDVSRLREGDIIFQTSKSSQSKAIQLATHSKFSHMGIVRSEGGALFVCEAVQPVKLTPVYLWIERGEGGHFAVMRLKNADTVLNQEGVRRIRSEENRYLGKKYDPYFEWSDDRMYCSELVWKVFDRAFHIQLGRLQHGSDFDFTHPVVQQSLKVRFPGGFPPGEPCISPRAIFESDQIETVYVE